MTTRAATASQTARDRSDGAGSEAPSDAQAVATFFGGLNDTDQRARLGRLDATYRFDLRHAGGTDHWQVTARGGVLHVSRRHDRAGSILTTDRAVFAGMVTGVVRVWPALLRDVIAVEGDLHALMLFTRLLPGPPAGGAPAAAEEDVR